MTTYSINMTSYLFTSYLLKNNPLIYSTLSSLKGFVFNFDYTRSNYQNKTVGQKNIYEIMNATLSYTKENTAWSYKITAQNLLDAQFKQSNGFSEYLVSDSKTFILPRILLFTIGYNL